MWEEKERSQLMSMMADWSFAPRQRRGGGQPYCGSSWLATRETPPFLLHGPKCVHGDLCGIPVSPNGYEAATSQENNNLEVRDPGRQRSKPPCSLPSLTAHP